MSAVIERIDPGPAHQAGRLKAQLRRAGLASRLRAYLLIAPLFLFVLVTFMVPIGTMLFHSIDNRLLPELLPRSVEALRGWDPAGGMLPPERVFATFAEELRSHHGGQEVSRIGTRINYEQPGLRNLLLKTARRLEQPSATTWREALPAIDERWGKIETWAVLRRVAEPYTLGYYLNALDLRYTAAGDIERQPPDLRLYLDVFLRTFGISGLVTALCLLLGYPLAYLLASLPPRSGNLLMILVLLPFWTSILVRTTAWVVILQTEGLLNDLLLLFGLVEQRVQLVFNRFGVVVAMVHILLPYMVLSLYSVMKGISPSYVRAARSLGASPVTAFRRVYLPQTLPGVCAGGLLVFILALGYYITPAMLGGANDQMVSFYVADHVNNSLNWGLAAALGSLLLLGVFALYGVHTRLTRNPQEL